MKRHLVLLALLALAGCAAAPAPEIPGCREGPCIQMGQSQTFGIMAVTPLEVLEDSRCPIEAECVWAGRFRIRARLDIGHETIETEIEAWQPLTINGGTLLLEEVAPDPSVQWPKLAPGDYSMRFSFTPSGE